jgi:hypothetical protein
MPLPKHTLTLLLACCVALSGCVGAIFPTDNPLPYADADLARIEIGSSTRDDVIRILGQPQLMLRGGNLWIYGRSRAKLSDGLGSYEHDYQAIFVMFTNSEVAAKDLLHADLMYLTSSCWSEESGLCLHSYWEATDGSSKPMLLSRRFSAVTSRGDDDANAKRFTPDEGNCAVYVYSGRSFFRGGIPVVTIGESKDEPVPPAGYLFFQSSPGQLTLVAGKNRAVVDCQANVSYFYKLETLLFEDADDIRIESVTAKEGIESVNERHILVTW